MRDDGTGDGGGPLRPDDEVGALFRLAGRRPRLPETQVAPVRAAAREAWRRQVRAAAARRRRVWAGMAAAAGLALAAGLAFWTGGREGGGAPVATLELEQGAVVFGGAGQAAGGGALGAGTVITTGAGGSAAVRLGAGGPALRIDAGSEVRLDSPRRVTLSRGAVYVDARGGAGGSEGFDGTHSVGGSSGSKTPGPIEVSTPLGTVRDVGTQFEVRLLAAAAPGPAASPAAALRVRVREGAVVVRRGGAAHAARAGGELTLLPDGSARRGAAAVHGPAWDWVQRAAPPLDVEGATLATFLAWARRETGLTWRIVGPPPHPDPEAIVLHGSLAGLTPEEAIAVVLPGAGFRHRRVGGELWLEPATE